MRVPSRAVAGGGVQEGLACRGCWEAQMPSGDGKGGREASKWKEV